MGRSQTVQRATGWTIVVISFIHLAVTFIDYDALSLRALWFVGSGFALLLIGGLNVITSSLDDASFCALVGVRALTLVANVCGVMLGLLYLWLTNGSQPQGPVLIVMFAIAAIAQLRRRATTPHPPTL
jgi:hypothetical protein